MKQQKNKLAPAEVQAESLAAEASIESLPAEGTKAKHNATAAHQARRVAPAKAKATRKTTSPKNAPKAQETAAPRAGTKAAQVVALLRRKSGVTLADLMARMSWQRHTVRGFMAGAMKKAGYAVESFKSDKGERTYRINDQTPVRKSSHSVPAKR